MVGKLENTTSFYQEGRTPQVLASTRSNVGELRISSTSSRLVSTHTCFHILQQMHAKVPKSPCSIDFKHFQTGSSSEPGSKCRARKCSKFENHMKNTLKQSLLNYLFDRGRDNILICKNAGSQSDGDPGCCHKQFQSNRCRKVSGWCRAKNEENGT